MILLNTLASNSNNFWLEPQDIYVFGLYRGFSTRWIRWNGLFLCLISHSLKKKHIFAQKVWFLSFKSSKNCRIGVVLTGKQQKSKKVLPESVINRREKFLIIPPSCQKHFKYFAFVNFDYFGKNYVFLAIFWRFEAKKGDFSGKNMDFFQWTTDQA